MVLALLFLDWRNRNNFQLLTIGFSNKYAHSARIFYEKCHFDRENRRERYRDISHIRVRISFCGQQWKRAIFDSRVWWAFAVCGEREPVIWLYKDVSVLVKWNTINPLLDLKISYGIAYKYPHTLTHANRRNRSGAECNAMDSTSNCPSLLQMKQPNSVYSGMLLLVVFLPTI